MQVRIYYVTSNAFKIPSLTKPRFLVKHLAICKDCNKEFTITVSEQKFYESKELALPKRCADCRAARKAANDTQAKVVEQPKSSLDDLMRSAGII